MKTLAVASSEKDPNERWRSKQYLQRIACNRWADVADYDDGPPDQHKNKMVTMGLNYLLKLDYLSQQESITSPDPYLPAAIATYREKHLHITGNVFDLEGDRQLDVVSFAVFTKKDKGVALERLHMADQVGRILARCVQLDVFHRVYRLD